MAVSSTTMTNTGASNSGSASQTKTALGEAKEQKDRFLKILLTQMQNQNPLDPQKPEQFAAQLAQFSQLEQQIDTNTKLEALAAQLGKASVSPVSYLGTTIDYNSATAPVQNQQAQWTYATDGSATKVKLAITDAAGNVYYSGDGDITAGTHTLQLTELASIPDGVPLTLKVTATNADNGAVNATITARATIDAVSTNNGVTTLEAGGYNIDTSLVKRIGAAKTASNNSNTNSNS